MSVGVVGVGGYLPERVLTNAEIETLTAYDRDEHSGRSLEEWVRRQHGGLRRRLASCEQATSDLATEAASRAIADAGLQPGDVDAIVLATVTSDQALPPAAAVVQANLCSSAKFFQLDSACTGFIDGLQVAMGLMNAFGYSRVLLICADTTAGWIHPQDWLSRTVFGDGAAAVVLGEVPDGFGFGSFATGSEGHLGHYVSIAGGGSRRPFTPERLASGEQYVRVSWRRVFGWAVDRMATAACRALADAGLTVEDVRWLIPHQASVPIITEAASRMGLPRERVVLTYPEFGNTIGSSLPLALAHAHEEGWLRHGDWLLLAAVGAGMAWGAAVLRWADRTSSRRPASGVAPTTERKT